MIDIARRMQQRPNIGQGPVEGSSKTDARQHHGSAMDEKMPPSQVVPSSEALFL